MTKKCNDCGLELDKESMFHKKSAGRCIPCYKLSRSKKYLANVDRLRERGRSYHQTMSPERKDEIKIRRKQYFRLNKDRELLRNKKWYHANKDRLKQEGKCWYINNRENIAEKRKFRNSMPSSILTRLTYQRDSYKTNTARIIQKDQEWASLPKNKIARRIRSRVRSTLKRNVNGSKTIRASTNEKLLGISYEDLVIHIQGLFVDNMSWDNYGTWHIDHIIPCSYFDLTIEENQRICFNYQNLQPLWALDNHVKFDNISLKDPEGFIEKIRNSL